MFDCNNLPMCYIGKRENYRPIGLVIRVFTNGQEDQSSIPGRVIPKTEKMVFDTTLLHTKLYKVQIKAKVE